MKRTIRTMRFEYRREVGNFARTGWTQALLQTFLAVAELSRFQSITPRLNSGEFSDCGNRVADHKEIRVRNSTRYFRNISATATVSSSIVIFEFSVSPELPRGRRSWM